MRLGQAAALAALLPSPSDAHEDSMAAASALNCFTEASYESSLFDIFLDKCCDVTVTVANEAPCVTAHCQTLITPGGNALVCADILGYVFARVESQRTAEAQRGVVGIIMRISVSLDCGTIRGGKKLSVYI